MKRTTTILSSLFILALLAGCAGQDNKIPDISMEEIKHTFKKGKEAFVEGSREVIEDTRTAMAQRNLVNALKKHKMEAAELEQQGDLKQALSKWEQVAALAPDDQEAPAKIRELQDRIRSKAYREKAATYERQHKWQQALASWEIAATLDPAAPEPAAGLTRLRKELARRAEAHFNRGITLVGEGSPRAKDEFILALRLDPEHGASLEQLEKLHQEEVFSDYRVRRDDTLKAIAQRFYRQPEKKILITYFTDPGGKKFPTAGATIRLPLVPEELLRHEPRITAEPSPAESLPDQPAPEVPGTGLALARSHLDAGDFRQAITVLEKIRQGEGDIPGINRMMNEAYYREALELRDENRYLASLALLEKIEPGYAGLDSLRAELRGKLRRDAQKHYNLGVKHYVKQDLAGAIREWETTLLIDPEHKKARTDMQKARELYERLKQVQ